MSTAPALDEKPRPTAVPTPAPAAPKGKRRTRILIVLAVLAVAGILYYLHNRKFEETDDAQIDGNISSVGARVTGTVTAVHVNENQETHVGQLLLEIDPTDLVIAVTQQKAAVALAQAQLQAEDPTVAITEASNTAAVAGAASDLAGASAGISGAEKDVEQLAARLVQAEGNAQLAELERKRGDELMKGQAIPRSDYDRRVQTAESAAADAQAIRHALAAAREKVVQQKAQLVATKSRLSEVRTNAPKQVQTRRASVLSKQANLDLAKAQLAQAETNLGYASLKSPVNGVIAKKGVSVGDHVSPGQQLMAIAQTERLWVTANFRETQLERIKLGQEVDVHVDALDRTLHGRVESLGGATGARLSVLPPENAAGNFVKVVQRIPVRITIDPGQEGIDRLRPGMSVEPKIRVVP
jgi:membrane fusion protein (multidrug efflux system)